jgi:HPt (histidine-containing phosphotransfer) domain-containing protein
VQQPEGGGAALPVLDEAVLEELSASVQGDRAFVMELVETYLADGPAELDGVAAAISADDAAALVRPAHTLKSSSATVGAARLAAAARELEFAGRSGTLGPDAAGAGRRLRAEWDDAASALRRWLDAGAAPG